MPNYLEVAEQFSAVLADPKSEKYALAKATLADESLSLRGLIEIGLEAGVLVMAPDTWSETWSVLSLMPESMKRQIMKTLRAATAENQPVRFELSPGQFHLAVTVESRVVVIDVTVPVAPDPARAVGARPRDLDTAEGAY